MYPPDPLPILFILWIGWRLMRIHQQWVDERREKATRRLVVPVEPGRKRHSHRRTLKPWQRPRY